jgi:hypothetical protein
MIRTDKRHPLFSVFTQRLIWLWSFKKGIWVEFLEIFCLKFWNCRKRIVWDYYFLFVKWLKFYKSSLWGLEIMRLYVWRIEKVTGVPPRWNLVLGCKNGISPESSRIKRNALWRGSNPTTGTNCWPVTLHRNVLVSNF